MVKTVRVAGLVLVLASGMATPAGAQANLLVDGGGESDTGGNGGAVTPPGPPWTATDTASVISYATGGGFPDANTPGPLVRGNNFFGGGNGGSGLSTITQTIDLSANQAAIDAGSAPYTLCGYLGGYAGQNDNAKVDLDFQTAASASLGADSIGPVLSEERDFTTALCLKSTSGTVPVGTRKVVVTVTFTLLAIGGPSNDGYADEINFVLGASCPVSGGGGCTTTTTSTTAPTTTSTSVPSTTSTSIPTTTSTSIPSTTSTSIPTTTSTSIPSTTSTSSPAPTSTSTSSTSSSTTTAPAPTTTTTSSTPTTSPTTSTITSTTATTTTLAVACATGATFEAIECGLAALLDEVTAATDLGNLQQPLLILVDGARDRFEQVPGAPNRRKAKGLVKGAAKKLTAFAHRLKSRAGRNVPQPTRDELGAAATTLRSALVSFRQTL